jgi:hypothetical protein
VSSGSLERTDTLGASPIRAGAAEREKALGRVLTEKGLATTRGATVRRGAAGILEVVEAAGFFATEVEAAERTDFTGIVPLSFTEYCYYLRNIHKNQTFKTSISLGN